MSLLIAQSVYMAHALRRISYATCDPESRQFSFLAREPQSPSADQYCHAFVTQTEQEVSLDQHCHAFVTQTEQEVSLDQHCLSYAKHAH